MRATVLFVVAGLATLVPGFASALTAAEAKAENDATLMGYGMIGELAKLAVANCPDLALNDSGQMAIDGPVSLAKDAPDTAPLIEFGREYARANFSTHSADFCQWVWTQLEPNGQVGEFGVLKRK